MVIPNHARAALWMIFFCFCMACMSGMIRYMSEYYHALELVFFRNLFGFLFIVPLVWHAGFHTIKTKRYKLYLSRAVLGTAAMSCWFIGVTLIPLSDATALSFTIPIFTTIGAWLFLKERVRYHRWIAIGIGFFGALVIVRPGFETIHPGALIVILSSVFIAGTMLMVKELTRTEHSVGIVFYMGLFMIPISLVGAIFVWETPALEHYPMLLAMGGIASIGQVGLSNALRAADASVSMPFKFTNMVFSTAIGVFFFNEIIDLWTWIGAVIIFSSTLYIVRREARLSKEIKSHQVADH